MSTPNGPSTTPARPSGHQTAEEPRPKGQEAAEKATQRAFTRVTVPLIGTVTLPPPEQLAFLGGIAVLTALEIIEWPVGLTLAAGHVIAAASHNKVLQEFGIALQEV